MTTTNIVYISVYDISTYMASGYRTIGVFTNSAIAGTFTKLTTSATRITLVSTTDYYTYTHTGSGITDSLYKYKYFKASGASGAFITAPYYAGTSDLTEDLRYAIEDTDTTVAHRYTIKELRRYICKAIGHLRYTLYKRKFAVDFDGIITPRINDYDRNLIVNQGVIEVCQSQLTRAADTAITFSDGRGRFSSQTYNALHDTIKLLQTERNQMIATYNRESITSVACTITLSATSA